MLRICRAIILALMLFPLWIAVAGAQSHGVAVSLDHVDGLIDSGVVASATPITFYIRAQNNGAISWPGVINGFTVYSPDGVPVSPITAQWHDATDWDSIFDLLYRAIINARGDSVEFEGAAINPLEGAPPGIDEIFWEITVPPIDTDLIGSTICLDSIASRFVVSGSAWIWVTSSESAYPTWDGEHCFTVGGCCRFTRGNADGDPNDEINVNDLVYLVNYAFRGGPPPVCVEEGDADGSGSLTPFLGDILYLVDYLFKGGPAPSACP